jgi:ribosomal protein L40E
MQQICEKCGKVNFADAIQCTDCNSDLRTQDATVILSASAAVAAKAAMEPSPSAGLGSRFNTCPACSTVNVANASICRSCGHQLASTLRTPAVAQTSLAPVSDLDDTRPPIPLQELGAAPVAAASSGKKTLWIALGSGGLLIAAALAWWLMSAPSSSKNVPVKPNPFALPPEAMVSAPATPAAQTPAPAAESATPAQDASTSVPSVSQSLGPQETIVAPSTPAADNTRQAAARDTASKQALSREDAASAPDKKDAKATDATRPSTPPAAARTTAPAPPKESTAARPNGATAPGSASAEAAAQPAPSAQANSPKEVCSTRFVLAQPFCMQEQCGLPRFTNHAQCVQMRAQQQETQQRMQERN